MASHSLFSLIYDSLNDILDGTAHAADFVIDSVRVPEIKSNFTESENQIQSSNYFQFNPESEESVIPADTQTEIKYYDPCKDNFFFDINKEKEEHLMCVSNDSIPAGLGKDPRVDEAYERRKYEQQMIEYESCKYKGNLFNTYLMYEICDKVYIIDQHAAHERLIYDRLREKSSKEKSTDRFFWNRICLRRTQKKRNLSKQTSALSEVWALILSLSVRARTKWMKFPSICRISILKISLMKFFQT